MLEQTITTNHPIQLWVVFIGDKPLTILLNGQISLKTHKNDHAIGGNGGLRIFCSKMSFDMVKKFPLHIFKPLGWFFLMAILSIVHKVIHLTN